MKPAEADRAAAEFADKMQQVPALNSLECGQSFTCDKNCKVLGRFESVQDVLVMCLVRMLGCGNRHSVAETCPVRVTV